MKIQSVFLTGLLYICCTGAFAEPAAPAATGAATGLCKDGTEYTGASKKGACRGHKGIKDWYADKTAAPVATAPAAPAAAKPAAPALATPAATPSAAATGLCKDGTEYTGASKKGACRGHKGIKDWYADKTAAPVATAPAAPAVEKPAAPAATTPAATPSAAATGLCKDGTEYTGASKKGACRGHKGIKDWYADKTAAPAAVTTPAATPAPAAAAATAKPAETAPSPAPATTPAPTQTAPAVTPAPAAQATTPSTGQVWVNTKTKIYHCEDTRFYGKTKAGEYMSEADAQAKGYSANRKKTCK